MKRYVDRVLVIFPFEEELYRAQAFRLNSSAIRSSIWSVCTSRELCCFVSMVSIPMLRWSLCCPEAERMN